MNKNTNTYLAFLTSGRRNLRALLKPLLTVGLLSVSSLMAANKMSPDLQGLPASASVDVILQFTHPPSAVDLSAVNRAGGVVKQQFQSLNGALATLKAGQLKGLSANPNITYISLDRKLSGSLEFAEPTVNANVAFQYGWNGFGVGVAIIDSGI